MYSREWGPGEGEGEGEGEFSALLRMWRVMGCECACDMARV